MLDAFDPEIAFTNQEHNYKLPNFIELKKNSVTHHKLFAPAKGTLFSIPAMLMGEYIGGYNQRKHRFLMISKDFKEFLRISYVFCLISFDVLRFPGIL